jgi:UPF0716 protein FxsA
MIRLVVGLFLIVMPVLELTVLIKIGQLVGTWTTILLVVTAAFTGILIISRQSFTVFRQTLEAMSEGRAPLAQVVDGVFLMLAGALLVTPGFITDLLAIPLLVPPIRRAIGRWSVSQVLDGVESRVGKNADEQEGRQSTHPGHGPIIEGEFERLAESSTPYRSNGAGAP